MNGKWWRAFPLPPEFFVLLGELGSHSSCPSGRFFDVIQCLERIKMSVYLQKSIYQRKLQMNVVFVLVTNEFVGYYRGPH